jgi:hypothetical protein
MSTGGKAVRYLNADDLDAYVRFRFNMWPVHPAAGAWEAVRLKYHDNPQIAACPGSGLYGYWEGTELVGIMGAYPMPVTLNGDVYPGHMLSDWAVLPNCQFGRAAGALWNELTALPGRKFATIGSAAAQRVFNRRAARISSGKRAVAILRPIASLLLRAQQLEEYAYSSPLFISGNITTDVDSGLSEGFEPPGPARPLNTAFVARDRNFWKTFCSARILNGALPMRISAKAGGAELVLRLLEVGKYRYALLLTQRFSPPTKENAAAIGKVLRQTLLALGVALVRLVNIDELTSALLRSLSSVVFQRPSLWYAVKVSSDTFDAGEVTWWLTYGDSDSHWAGLQPMAPGPEGMSPKF